MNLHDVGPKEALVRLMNVGKSAATAALDAEIVGILEKAACPLTESEIYLVLACRRAKEKGLSIKEVIPDFSPLVRLGLSDAESFDALAELILKGLIEIDSIGDDDAMEVKVLMPDEWAAKIAAAKADAGQDEAQS